MRTSSMSENVENDTFTDVESLKNLPGSLIWHLAVPGSLVARQQYIWL